MDNEEWRPVPGYEGLYDVSSWGRVRSIRSPLMPRAKGDILALPPDYHGRLHVTLHKDRRQFVVHVHRLVAEAFYGPLPAGLETRHLNGDPINNRVENLAYGTRSQNQIDAVNHGTNSSARKTHCANGHAFDEPNTYRDRKGYRHCRTCRRLSFAAWRHRRRAAA